MEVHGRKFGKTMQMIMQAWVMAGDNPGKKIAVSMVDGIMVLEFKKQEGFGDHEIDQIEIDGEKKNAE